ncbi:MAG: hypothetical protein H6R18_2145 [Proteobacteria bacterium]|nr:hypothetical protein [Pseudomonadota bacterium]
MLPALDTNFPNLKVLAVDDNRTNLHILSVFLKKLGHEVILAENGDEGLLLFDEERPDVILLDIMMPGLDGFEVARRIKERVRDFWVPIVFLSALNRDENLVEGLEAGGDDYLTKPINFVVLEAKMRSIQRSLMLQQRAIESFERLQAISDSVLEAIITINTQGTIVSANAAAETIFGWSVEELVGKDISMLMPEPHCNRHQQYLDAYVAGGPPHIVGYEREVEALRRDGTIFPAELGVSEIRLEEGRLFIGVIRDVTERKRTERKLRDNAEQLQAYYDTTQAEQNLAMTLMQKQLHRRGLQDEHLRYTVIPAERFSGDIVAAVRTPEGRFYAMLADATGHGLAAAISVLPILSVFYGMTTFNHSVSKIVLELNEQLRESVPVGRFVAACLVCLDENTLTGEIWVGGTPPALLIDNTGKVECCFDSTRLPLGIIGNEDLGTPPDTFQWSAESQILICSDGLLDAEGSDGARFESTGLQAAIANTDCKGRFDAILGALGRHLDGQRAADDVSIMLVDCP